MVKDEENRADRFGKSRWRDLRLTGHSEAEMAAGKLILRRFPDRSASVPSLSLRMTASEGLADNGKGKD